MCHYLGAVNCRKRQLISKYCAVRTVWAIPFPYLCNWRPDSGLIATSDRMVIIHMWIHQDSGYSATDNNSALLYQDYSTSGMDYGNDCGNNYGSDYSNDYGNNYGSDYGNDYGNNYS